MGLEARPPSRGSDEAGRKCADRQQVTWLGPHRHCLTTDVHKTYPETVHRCRVDHGAGVSDHRQMIAAQQPPPQSSIPPQPGAVQPDSRPGPMPSRGHGIHTSRVHFCHTPARDTRPATCVPWERGRPTLECRCIPQHALGGEHGGHTLQPCTNNAAKTTGY